MAKSSSSPPTVYIVAGPNGAGKPTFASAYLPVFVHCREFLNADLIASGLSPFSPASQNRRAGRLLLERIRELPHNGADFGFETTLSGRTYVKLLTELRANAYRLILFFLWLPNAEMAVTRVANRVKQGGHDVPRDDIRRRYAAGQTNLFRLYRPILHQWWLYDASRIPPKEICSERSGQLTINDRKSYRRIERRARVP